MADETKWSPEPWNMREVPCSCGKKGRRACRPDFAVSAARWDELATVYGREDDEEGHSEGQANARRIVVAVNSVAGIPSAALEAGLLTRALDLVAVGFLTDDCDGSEEGCPSCEARRLLKALGRIA
jgi:hypothetical protein